MTDITRTVEIDLETLNRSTAAIPPATPVIMVNMLKFREQADYGTRSDVAACSGRDAYYEHYVPVAAKIFDALGGSIFWQGKVLASVICPDYEQWDDLLLVQYPDIDCLRRLFADPEYQKVVFHRTAALSDSRLIATATVTGFG